jgi:nitrite reductase/ring-hydroxylating ferredoxin subunit
MPRFIEVAKMAQIPEHGTIGVEIEGKCLALVKLEGEVYALADTCPHAAGPLSEGQIIGEDIEVSVAPVVLQHQNRPRHQGSSRRGRRDV